MKKNIILPYFLYLILFPATLIFAGGSEKKSLNENYKIESGKSSVRWTAKSVKGGHFGDVNIKNGTFAYDGKAITGGTVTIDMNSISVKDIEDPNRQNRLAGHLKNDDFFSADKFPEAKLVIKSSKPGKTAGQLDLTGDLTIKGITKPVTFPATVKSQGGGLHAEGTITVDRIQYDIKYRSKSVLDPSALADRLIYDEFTLDFKVSASK